MKFANLNKRLQTIDTKPKRYKKSKGGIMKFLLIILGIIIILGVAIYLPARSIYKNVKQLSADAKAISAAAKNENLDDIRKNLADMKTTTDSLNSNLNYLFWLRAIPFLGGYYADAKHFATAGSLELEAANKLADSLDPYKNELGFTGQPTPGQDRVAQFVKILDKLNPKLPEVEPLLKQAKNEVESVDVDKYPDSFGKTAVKSRVAAAKNLIIGADIAITEAKPAIDVAPQALGSPSPKTYLILFQNDKELRATGGFLTAYAFLTLDHGHVSSSSSDDIYRLDEKLLNTCLNKICPLTPPDPIVKYLPEANGQPRTAWSIRDSNLSPDVPTSMQQFEKMYNMIGGQQSFDGIILIDTHVVEELIKLTGPIEVFGTTYSADNDNRCNCPNVIYELENYSQRIEKGEADRKAILGTLMQQILARSLGVSTERLPEFINTSVDLASEKHVMFYMHDNKTQKALSDLNWTGEIKNPNSDYLAIIDSNFAGGKSNLYVNQEVTLNITTDSSGKVVNKLDILYKNSQPFNTWLNAINRDYIRIYVPKGSTLVSSKGSDVKVNTLDDDLGHTVFDAFIQIRPQNSRTISFEYQLPAGMSVSSHPILIQKQAGKADFTYHIKVNGNEKKTFDLSGDQSLNL